ncbi:MAG: hypothetical protein LLG97_01480 [Deltaproteobacteria bacterium]|nr:hypothetical protein [Deltaproteobacteria bacterium]
MPDDLRSRIDGEEFDYLALLSALDGYARPRDRITALLRRGEIVRVKKGIYVFGEGSRARPFSPEVLANRLFGPSYISLDSALWRHGLIPERPEAVTSVTCGRPRRFSTPVGPFVYRPLSLKAYRIGIDQALSEGGRPFLIATPEKALADKVHDARGTALLSLYEMESYLTERLGIAPERLAALDVAKLAEIRHCFGSAKIQLLHRVIRRLAACREAKP